jgi:hypothetical protein
MAEQTMSSQERQKRELQSQIRDTRDSLRETVEQIQDRAEQKYKAVKETVSDVLDYRDEFQKEPVIWSLGALSAGFALGYTLGYSHKVAKTKKGSEFARFADRVVGELSHVGQRLVLPELNAKIAELFGFDFAGLLQQMREKKTSSKPRRLRAPRGSRTGRKRRAGRSRPSTGILNNLVDEF